MSRLLSSITSALEQLFGKFLPSWKDPAPVPPETAEPPEPEEESEVKSDGRVTMRPPMKEIQQILNLNLKLMTPNLKTLK